MPSIGETLVVALVVGLMLNVDVGVAVAIGIKVEGADVEVSVDKMGTAVGIFVE